MSWIFDLVKNPDRPELYLILGIAALAATIGKLYRDVCRKDREMIVMLKEHVDVGNQTIACLLAIVAPKDLAAAGGDAGASHLDRAPTPPTAPHPATEPSD